MPDLTDQAVESFLEWAPLGRRVAEILPDHKKNKGVKDLFQRLGNVRRVHDETQRKINESPQAIPEHLDAMRRELLPAEDDAQYEERTRASRERLERVQAASALLKAHKDASQEAVRVMTEYAAEHPDDAEALSSLAIAHRNAGSLPEAIRIKRQTLALRGYDDRSGSGRYFLAVLLQENGEHEAALGELQSVIRDTPESALFGAMLPLHYFLLGKILWELGDAVNARIAWKEAETWDDSGHVRPQVEAFLRGGD
jgi:tetratricopeptide (TPR) repeat protein